MSNTREKKPSPAQLLVLAAADAKSLFRREALYKLYQPFATGSYSGAIIQSRTVNVCWDRGWLRLGEAQGDRRGLLLTTEGQAALDRWGGASNGE